MNRSQALSKIQWTLTTEHTGTISRVEDKCRAILDQHAWEQNPIRFLIIDLGLVGGLDLSAAEAFVRVHRMLVAKHVILVFCGQPPTSEVAIALRAVGLWSSTIQTFATLNEVREHEHWIHSFVPLIFFTYNPQALEWTENAYLRAWYASSVVKNESQHRAQHQPIGTA